VSRVKRLWARMLDFLDLRRRTAGPKPWKSWETTQPRKDR
jgi:hypothetical protein